MPNVAPHAAGAPASPAMLAATHAKLHITDRRIERLRAMYPSAAEITLTATSDRAAAYAASP
jgi:hypothetical protein